MNRIEEIQREIESDEFEEYYRIPRIHRSVKMMNSRNTIERVRNWIN